MKILLDLQGAQTESRLRGIGRQNMALTRAILAEAGPHEIHLLLNRRLDEGLSAILEDLDGLIDKDRIHVFGVPGGTAERHPENLWRTHAAEYLREAAIAAIAPEIVHIGSLFEGYVDDAVTSIGRFDAKWANAATLHDLIPLNYPDVYLADPQVRRHWLRRAQYLKRADVLLAVSQFSADEAESLLAIPASRIRVISAGVDPSFSPVANDARQTMIREKYRLDAPFIMHVGAVDYRKNVDLLLQSFGALSNEEQAGHLIAFVGRLFEGEVNHLRLAAVRAGIALDRLRFCQFVTEGELPEFYRMAEALVFPSRHEGFGLPALEAMASGTPVLAADAAALVELVNEPDFRFDPNNSADLSDRLHRLFAEPAFGDRLRAWGPQRASEFTWGRAAKRSFAAFEEAINRHSTPTSVAGSGAMIARKPLLAFFSPLPGQKSGIADYSAQLLRELGCYYEIECFVTDEVRVTDPWILANFVVRSYGFFEKNSERYDRIVYSIGNSSFHADMLELCERYPGVVILHDFFLSDLIDWMSNVGHRPYEYLFRQIYRTHGLSGLYLERTEGRTKAVQALACNSQVFTHAVGVIVHSHYAAMSARALYGKDIDRQLRTIPHLKGIPTLNSRAAARRRLGIGETEFVVASFGLISQRKRASDILMAWRESALSESDNARLVFVGGEPDGPYRQEFETLKAATPGRVTVLGYATPDDYKDYLAAADVAIQLRSETRGETSGTILDCLAAGLPLIINANGPAAEIPGELVTKLPNAFTVQQLRQALETLSGDPQLRADRGARGQQFVRNEHHPAKVGEAFYEAIEQFSSAPARLHENLLLDAISDFVAPIAPDGDDLRRVSLIMGTSRPRVGLRRIFFDVTVLAESDAKTGIQRVVRSVLINLIQQPPVGYHIEAVYMSGQQLRYARKWLADTLGLPSWVYPDDPVDFDVGDIYLSIDWVPDRLPLLETWLSDFRRAGGMIAFAVHDLLPFQFPQYFPDYMPDVTGKWFETVLRTADKLICVSRAVADDVIRYGQALIGDRKKPIEVHYFHNAADLEGSLPTMGMPEDAAETLATLQSRPTFLMVGTVEPRKGHEQVLRGIEQLWRDGFDINLVVVGKTGWMMEGFTEIISKHPESGRRLFWLEGISDEYLGAVYRASSALIAASHGEGFGLPLVEAARHNLPIIARSIPVFQEVAGGGAVYFTGETPGDVAEVVKRWLARDKAGNTADVSLIRPKTWKETTQQIIACLLNNDNAYGTIRGGEG